jgi:hypothetical protein
VGRRASVAIMNGDFCGDETVLVVVTQIHTYDKMTGT